jgi:hypothetical protein
MNVMTLPYDGDYLAVNVGAHRKPAPALDTPSVIQHFAFWQPRIPKEKWHEAIDYFLFRIFMRLQQLVAQPGYRIPEERRFHCPNLDCRESRLYLCRHNIRIRMNSDGTIQDYDDRTFRQLKETKERDRSIRYEVFSIYTQLLGIDLTVRAELRNEFWTLTFIGDFSSSTSVSLKTDAHNKIVFAFKEFGALFSKRIITNRAQDFVNPIDSDEETRLYNLGNDLYDSFYDLVSKKILDECEDGFPKEIGFANIGGLFADFRGAVIGITVKHNNSSNQNEINVDPYKFVYKDPLRPSSNLRRTIHSHKIDLSYAEDNLGLRIVDALWPAVKEFYSAAEPATVALEALAKPEFVATFFQDGRSIYISSLGRLANKSLSQRQEPVRYTVICSYTNRWELGRLVERINNMGTLRLAAIHNIAELQDASDKMRTLYDNWQANGHNSDFDLKSFSVDVEKLGSNIDPGLAYRIERSVYYVKSFVAIRKGLRERRLEGFQPYKNFVQRRLGGTFDFIERIGIRYRELRSEVELALERERTENITRLQEAAVSVNANIESIQASIDVTIHNLQESQEQSNNLLRQTVALNTNISKIQQDIEKATRGMNVNQHDTNTLLLRAEWLVGITLTYYIGTIIFEFLKEVCPHLGLWKYLAYLMTATTVTIVLRQVHPHGKMPAVEVNDLPRLEPDK